MTFAFEHFFLKKKKERKEGRNGGKQISKKEGREGSNDWGCSNLSVPRPSKKDKPKIAEITR
jgi:hypothetical protein